METSFFYLDSRRLANQLPRQARIKRQHPAVRWLLLAMFVGGWILAAQMWWDFRALAADGVVVSTEIERLPDSGPDDFVRVHYFADGQHIVRDDWMTAAQVAQVEQVFVQYARRDPHHATPVYSSQGLAATDSGTIKWWRLPLGVGLFVIVAYVLGSMMLARRARPLLVRNQRLQSGLFAGATHVVPGRVVRVEDFWDGITPMVRLYYAFEAPPSGHSLVATVDLDDAPLAGVVDAVEITRPPKTITGDIAWPDEKAVQRPPIDATLAILYLDNATHMPL